MIRYKARKSTSPAGTVNVYVEKINSDRPNPDPWGDGPIVEVTVASGLRITETEAVETAMQQARQIANDKQSAGA